jgi:hypothetical protein
MKTHDTVYVPSEGTTAQITSITADGGLDLRFPDGEQGFYRPDEVIRTLTLPQANMLHLIASQARQTIDGDSPMQSVQFHETDDTEGWHFEVVTWNTHTQKEEQAKNAAVYGLRDKIVAADIPCELQLADQGIYSCEYYILP